MGSEREALIRDRAYAIWLSEGRPLGRQDEHWRRAEAQIGDEEAARDAAAPWAASLAPQTQASAKSRGTAKPRAAHTAASPARRGRARKPPEGAA